MKTIDRGIVALITLASVSLASSVLVCCAMGATDPTPAMSRVEQESTVDGILAQLSRKPEEYLFERLAERGEAAKAAGPVLVDYLRYRDWDMRVYAARALGYIGYTNAVSALTEALGNTDDWRLAYVSAESLGRLRAKGAVGALAATARAHWFPPVREAASKAIGAINGTAAYESERNSSMFPFEFTEYENAKAGRGTASDEDSSWEDGLLEVDRMLGVSHLSALGLRYTVVVRDFRSALINGQSKECFDTRIVMPDVSLQVVGGHVVGRDMGEFGGELVFLGRDGKQSLLVAENTAELHRTAGGIVAVTGLAHMMTDKGLLYKVSEGADRCGASQWKVLPGAPRYSRLLQNGDLFVACHGGSVIVSSDGDMRIATSAEELVAKDQAVWKGIRSLILLLGGFLLLLLCDVALLFPCFRGLALRFTMLGSGVLPFAYALGAVECRGLGCGWGISGVVILGVTLIALMPVVFSVIGIIRNDSLSRTRRNAYALFDVFQAVAILWSLGVCWMVGTILGGMA